MRALITCFQIVDYSGSVIVSLDLAKELKERGYEVFLATYYARPSLREKILELGFSLIEHSEFEQHPEKSFDLLWGHHSVILDDLFSKGFSFRKLIFSNLSPFEPYEFPPTYIDLFDKSVANSWETSEKLKSFGVNSTYIFPNSIPKEYMEMKPKKLQNLKKILIVSNHVPPEILGAKIQLESRGIVVGIIGREHNHVLVTPDLLYEADAVISIGRTVQLSIGLGIPVYCYDIFGGDGWIGIDNFDINAKHNFSGRASYRKLTDVEISKEIIAGYLLISKQMDCLSKKIKDDFNFSTHLTKVLSFETSINDYKSIRNIPAVNKAEVDSALIFTRLYFNNLKVNKEFKEISLKYKEAKKLLDSTTVALEEIKNSTSWKITKPLRYVGKILKLSR